MKGLAPPQKASPKATPIATQLIRLFPNPSSAALQKSSPPELTAGLLVKRHECGELLWGVTVEVEAYSQDAPAKGGNKRRCGGGLCGFLMVDSLMVFHR
jgi:DNA-3-methyladenine glycosylase